MTNNKLQITNNIQYQNYNDQNKNSFCGFGDLGLEFICHLVFVICNF